MLLKTFLKSILEEGFKYKAEIPIKRVISEKQKLMGVREKVEYKEEINKLAKIMRDQVGNTSIILNTINKITVEINIGLKIGGFIYIQNSTIEMKISKNPSYSITSVLGKIYESEEEEQETQTKFLSNLFYGKIIFNDDCVEFVQDLGDFYNNIRISYQDISIIEGKICFYNDYNINNIKAYDIKDSLSDVESFKSYVRGLYQ